ncbi:unnamed protein product [Closterium sp. NIES-53]
MCEAFCRWDDPAEVDTQSRSRAQEVYGQPLLPSPLSPLPAPLSRLPSPRSPLPYPPPRWRSLGQMCEAFCKWDDAAQVEKSVPFFKALGGRHLNYGIDGNDFPVFRTGFMKALKKAFGERWHGELEGAWCAAFDMLEGVASTGMAEGGGFKRMPAFMLA